MKLRDVKAAGLQLRAYAPTLRLMARIVEQVLYLDPADSVLVTDVLNRVVTYIRTLANEVAVAQSGIPTFSVAKSLVEIVNQFDESLKFDTSKACKDLAVSLETLALGLTKTVQDYPFVADQLVVSTSKGLLDATSGSLDSAALGVSSVLSDAANASEVFTPIWAYTKQFLDQAILGDSKTLSFGKNVAESVLLTERQIFVVSTHLLDLLSAPLDSTAFKVSKPFSDTTGTSDSAVVSSAFATLLNEGGDYVDPAYADFFYFDHSPQALDTSKLLTAKGFAESSVASDNAIRVATQFRVFAEAATFSEQMTFANSKTFTDSGTTSDTASRAISMYLLEGGYYADPDYFVASDYVSGGLVAYDALTHSP